VAALESLRAHPVLGSSGAVALTSEQEAAVAAALRSPLTLVSGGPGTGKTSIVVAILRAAVDALALEPSSVALAAPTGKAADRMRRSIEAGLLAIADPTAADRRLLDALPEPRTLHRLLGFSASRGTFRHHAQNPLSERLVVVDESSMIDVFLMERLVESLHPSARLVLLGDAEQLPSVAAGAVFRDLESAASITSVRLTRSHRMDPSRPEGFNILAVAARLNQGEMPRLAPTEVRDGGIFPSEPTALGALDALPEDPDALGGAFLLPLDGSDDRERFLDWWYAHRVRGSVALERLAARTWPREAGRVRDDGALAPLFELAERARLLCVTRGAARATGVEAVNAALHRRFADDARAPVGLGLMLAGEPVLAHKNDYERGLFNGDQGMVLFTRSEDDDGPRPSAVFRRDDGFVAHPMEAVRGSLELGYATTVHKAQGSEHDAVALLLPETDSPRLLTREIVYTAITRARRSVLVLGSPALLERAARRRIERSSGIAERLAAIS
jgi:exodeoxyribonuclease V alpha subunit